MCSCKKILVIILCLGGVIVVSNWTSVNDRTKPDQVRDFRVLNAAADGNNIFTLGWTAAGDDLNIGQGMHVCQQLIHS